MPIFDFHCPDCQTDFEELVASSQEAAPPCPTCHGVQSRKKLSVIAKPATTVSQALPSCASGACDFGHSCQGGSCSH